MTSSTPNGVVTLLHGPLSAALAAASGTVTLASPYLGAGTARELADTRPRARRRGRC